MAFERTGWIKAGGNMGIASEMTLVDKDVFFEREGGRNLDARVMFHDTAVTTVMALSLPRSRE